MKVIKFNSPKGVFQIPLHLVAANRADYYAEKDGVDIGSKEHKEEIDWVVNDDYEGVGWLLNNTNWSDWKGVAVKVGDDVNCTDDDFWCDSDNFDIINVN